jgi:DNA-binding CsgD family transcriptional regulator
MHKAVADCQVSLMPAWDFKTLEEDFAEAALDPTLWKKALDAVTAKTGSYGAVLIPTTGAALRTLPFTDSMSSSLEAYVRDGWHLRDERYRGIAKMSQLGVVDDLDIFSPDTIAKHPYYQEFLAPHHLRWFAGIKVCCGDDLWCLSIQRTIDQNPFSQSEKDQLARLSRQLSTSAAIAKALGASAATGVLEAFEISNTAVLLINRHANIFKVNASAQRLLVDDVQIKRGKLVSSDEKSITNLNNAVYNLLQGREAGLAEAVALHRKGRRPLVAYAARFSSMTANALADCQALVILIDPEPGPRPLEATLRSVFRLSEAEARIAVQLGSGESLDAVADVLGVGKETSRTHLKSIFAKTGVHRQAELVAILSRLLNRQS